jgi:hypothetical protein
MAITRYQLNQIYKNLDLCLDNIHDVPRSSAKSFKNKKKLSAAVVRLTIELKQQRRMKRKKLIASEKEYIRILKLGKKFLKPENQYTFYLNGVKKIVSGKVLLTRINKYYHKPHNMSGSPNQSGSWEIGAKHMKAAGKLVSNITYIID